MYHVHGVVCVFTEQQLDLHNTSDSWTSVTDMGGECATRIRGGRVLHIIAHKMQGNVITAVPPRIKPTRVNYSK